VTGIVPTPAQTVPAGRVHTTYSVRLAQGEASDAELQATRGDKTPAQAAYYRRNADKKAGAARAVDRLDRAAMNKMRTKRVNRDPGGV
jgi:hypothetical protein